MGKWKLSRKAYATNTEYQRAYLAQRKVDDPEGHAKRNHGRKSTVAEAKDKRLRYMYRISLAQYEKMLAAQNGVCALCGMLDKRGHLSVDHDHSCCPTPERGQRGVSCGKCVRGLLCNQCNLALGHLERRGVGLSVVVAYQEKFARN